MSTFKKILIAILVLLLIAAGIIWYLLQGDPAEYTLEQTTGTEPVLAAPDAQTIPTVDIAEPVGWPDGAAPGAAEGLAVNRFAEGLDHPRVVYAMPNGDVLVTLTRRSPSASSSCPT